MNFRQPFTTALALWLLTPAFALDSDKASSVPNKGLYEQSIKTTKKSIDREMLDALYHDAVDAYREQHYDEALELLDQIYSLNPHYEDVEQMRDTIRKRQVNNQSEAAESSVHDYMRQGDAAYKQGQNVLAIHCWQQALDASPNYAPAKKKIHNVRQALARKQFEEFYIHYHRHEWEDALDAGSNAIAMDSSYKERGLLLLMSKIELQVHRDQVTRLASQGFDQYQQGDLNNSLQTYQELAKLEPRHEEARRMVSKIKIQLGQAAFKASRQALADNNFEEAITQAATAISNGYEPVKAQALKAEAERKVTMASHPKPVKSTSPVAAKPPPTASEKQTPAPPPVATEPANPEAALAHYRKGLAAIRTKDYHLALDELTTAAQLDPANEHIYMAKERARQEWLNATSQVGTQ